jgi:Protein of unknown function (DUF3632)
MFYQRLNENLSNELIDPASLLNGGEDPMDYVNAQAFRANLMSIDLMSMGHLLYVVSFLEEAMHEAFNEDHSKEPPQVRDARVMGAAQWIKWRAEEAFSLVQKPGDPEIQNECKRFSFWQSRKNKDDAIEKKWPYTWNQWQAWKDGFRAVAGSSEAYSSTCRTIAEEAADLMGMQEKGMCYDLTRLARKPRGWGCWCS